MLDILALRCIITSLECHIMIQRDHRCLREVSMYLKSDTKCSMSTFFFHQSELVGASDDHHFPRSTAMKQQLDTCSGSPSHQQHISEVFSSGFLKLVSD